MMKIMIDHRAYVFCRLSSSYQIKLRANNQHVHHAWPSSFPEAA